MGQMSDDVVLPPYDGSIPFDVWKLRRARDLKIAKAKASNLLTHMDAHGRPLYALTENGNLRRTNPLSQTTRAAVIARDGACVACGAPGPFEVDHIIRYVDGGSNDPSNLQTLCEPCHRSKGGH